VVRNGNLPEREVISGAGRIPVRQPRGPPSGSGALTSAILPKYMRRVPSVDALIPALYLKGISTGDFSEALTAILGEGASGLSATNIVRLKSGWETNYKAWIESVRKSHRIFKQSEKGEFSTVLRPRSCHAKPYDGNSGN
jgi:putative transposase